MKRLYWYFGILICLCWAGAAWASDLPGMSGSGNATTYDNIERDGCGPFTEVGSPLYHKDTTLVGADDHCGIRTAPDHIYRLTITQSGSYTFSLCGSQEFTDTYIYLLDGCCSGTEIARDNDGCGTYAGPSLLECITLSPDTYYVVVEAANANSGGPYTLDITICGNACEQSAFEPGTDSLSETSRRFVHTVDSSSPPPYYGGPRWDNSPCAENGGNYGFDFLSWYDNDFDWWHSWPGYDNSSIVSIDSAFVYICAWDVDEPCEISPVSRQVPCEMDLVSIGGGEARPLLPHLEGVSQGWSVTRFLVDSADLRDDSLLHVQLDIDANADSCNWAVNVHRSQLVVYYTINRSPDTPEGYGMPCVDDSTTMCLTITGPTPPDPDGDAVTYSYRWFVANLGTTYTFVDDETNPNHFGQDHNGPCIPSSDSDVGDIWKVQVFAFDVPHGAQSPNYLEVTFPIIIVDCGEPTYPDVDMGDLDSCNYPTLTNNPGHGRSGIAWLGVVVTGEAMPYEDDGDLDDGVTFLNVPWEPCGWESLTVTVTAGQFYPDYADTNGVLYLNAWKDGNHDGDFCDVLCDRDAPEWFLQNVIVVPSLTAYRFEVRDPGVDNIGQYEGIFRFRLTSRRMADAYGFGLIDTSACPNMICGSFDLDFLGEVEDYIITDLQLPVELMSFEIMQDGNGVVLRWSTASERDNDYFRIERRTSSAWSTVAARIRGAGTSSSSHSYTFRDSDVEAGTIYEYRLVSVDFNGTAQALGTQSIPVVQHDPVMVSEYRLYPNYPNPFNPTTTIAFDLAEAGHVSLRVYDVMGREVAVLVNGNLPAGRHREVFDAQGLPSGVYVYKLTSGSFTDMQKMVLLK